MLYSATVKSNRDLNRDRDNRLKSCYINCLFEFRCKSSTLWFILSHVAAFSCRNINLRDLNKEGQRASWRQNSPMVSKNNVIFLNYGWRWWQNQHNLSPIFVDVITACVSFKTPGQFYILKTARMFRLHSITDDSMWWVTKFGVTIRKDD